MNKILVAVDGSPLSKKAAAEALELAKKFGAKMMLISVAEVEPEITYTELGVTVPVEYINMRDSLVKIKEESAGKMLDAIIGSMDCTGVSIDKVIKIGIPAHEIVEYTESEKVDLVVLGHRGLNPLKRLFVGSVAKRVIEDAACSVMIVKKEEA